MKKLYFTIIGIFLFCFSNAQPWMPENPTTPIKLQDVIDRYNQNKLPLSTQNHAPNDEMKEGNDYLFQRWAWYWRHHLDIDGNMVAPIKTYQEWSNYLDTHPTQKTAEKSTSSFSANWVFQGPDATPGGYAGIGRINTVAFHPTDPNTFYIGSAGGGAWKTNDGGNSWLSMYGIMPTLGVSDIKVNPLNPNTIYVCTGDKDGHDNYSIGVIKSTDGGVTWHNTSISWLIYNYNYARSLLINPVDTNSLILATNVGIYKTFNGGATWANVAYGNFEQILYNTSDTNIIYATNYQSGFPSQILRSVNGGVTWAAVTTLTDVSRINIATCPASPNTVMAIVANSSNGLNGIYCSTDAGLSYNPTFTNDGSCTNNLLSWDLGMPSTACNGQGWYDLCIAIDPADANKIIIGGVNHYYSVDGGYSWNLATQWYSGLPGVQTVHADKHFLGYNPLNGALYATCDGGVYSTLDPVSGLWNDHTNGLGITEFYRIAIANDVSFCIGGAQDNGTKMVNGGVFSDIRGGDGMQCQIDYASPSSIWYASYYNGSIDRTMDGGSSWSNISSTIPDANGGDWVTPYIIHPVNNNMILVGYDILFLSTDFGNSWNPISPQFTLNYKINNIVVPYSNPNFIYLVLDDNSIRFSPDFGATWGFIPSSGTTAIISHICADPKNENILWVTFSGYYSGSKVYEYNRTTNHWSHHNGTLPNIPVNCIVIDSTTGTKYIGTETTVFYMDTTMADWAPYNINLPAVIVNDIKINYTNNELWAGTYGRGIWKTTKADHVTGISKINANKDYSFVIEPNPNHGSFNIKTSNKSFFGETVTVKLISQDGKIAYQKEQKIDNVGILHIDVTNLTKGTYICKVQKDQLITTNKVTIY